MTDTTRKHTRYTVEVAAEIEAGGEALVASTQNLSLGGAALVSDRAIRDGADVIVRLFLTQDGIEDPDEAPFQTKARVQWTRPADGGRTLAGVAFIPLAPDAKRHLERFLAALAG